MLHDHKQFMPAEATVVADFNKDGSLDAGLSIQLSKPTTGRDVGSFEVEVWKSATLGGTYTRWRSFNVPAEPTGDTTFDFQALAGRYFKARVRCITFNEIKGPWTTLTASGVQALGKTADVSAPVNVVVSAVRLGYSVKWNDPADIDYSHSEIVISASTSFASFTVIGSSQTTLNTIFLPDLSGYHVGVRHFDNSGTPSAITPANSNVSYTPGLITGTFVDNDTLFARHISDNEINERFIGVNNTEQTIGTSKFLLQSVTVDHTPAATSSS